MVSKDDSIVDNRPIPDPEPNPDTVIGDREFTESELANIRIIGFRNIDYARKYTPHQLEAMANDWLIWMMGGGHELGA